MSIDLQTTDGYSLLTDPHLLPGRFYLFLNMSRLDDGKQDTLYVQVVNETLYLPSGNYSVEASWSPHFYWSDHFDHEKADFAIHENSTTLLRMRLPTVQLSIECSTHLVSGLLWMYSVWDLEYRTLYSETLGSDTAPFLYIPASQYWIHISVYHQAPWGYPGGARLDYESDGSSDLLLSIDYPGIAVLGVVMTGLDIGTILLLAALIIALLAGLRHALFPKKTGPLLSDPGLVPVVMLVVGAFLPWFRYDYHIGLYSGVVLPPFSIITRQTAFGLTAPYMLDSWPLVLPLYLVLFWMPVLGALNQIGTEVPALSWRRVICVACPVTLALASWLVGAWIGWIPDAGMWLILLSPIVFLLQITFQRALAAIRSTE